jgi:hypothetical protein
MDHMMSDCNAHSEKMRRDRELARMGRIVHSWQGSIGMQEHKRIYSVPPSQPPVRSAPAPYIPSVSVPRYVQRNELDRLPQNVHSVRDKEECGSGGGGLGFFVFLILWAVSYAKVHSFALWMGFGRHLAEDIAFWAFPAAGMIMLIAFHIVSDWDK